MEEVSGKEDTAVIQLDGHEAGVMQESNMSTDVPLGMKWGLGAGGRGRVNGSGRDPSICQVALGWRSLSFLFGLLVSLNFAQSPNLFGQST